MQWQDHKTELYSACWTHFKVPPLKRMNQSWSIIYWYVWMVLYEKYTSDYRPVHTHDSTLMWLCEWPHSHNHINRAKWLRGWFQRPVYVWPNLPWWVIFHKIIHNVKLLMVWWVFTAALEATGGNFTSMWISFNTIRSFHRTVVVIQYRKSWDIIHSHNQRLTNGWKAVIG